MIPYLALMIGAYIVARMADQLARHTEHETARGVAIMLAIAAAGVAVACVVLILREASAARAQMDVLLR